MRIGTSAAEPAGADALVRLREELRRAADDGFASAWMSNIFGLDALTALAVAGSAVPGIEVATAALPTYPGRARPAGPDHRGGRGRPAHARHRAVAPGGDRGHVRLRLRPPTPSPARVP